MSNKQLNSFRVSRFGIPIEQVHIRDSVNTNIVYESVTFQLWEAAISAGATLDELTKLDTYPKAFQAKLIAWFEKHNLVKTHRQAAAAEAAKKRK